MMKRFSACCLTALLASACGGRSGQAPAPDDPASAVTAFLAAVQANDLAAMGRLFGTADRGPAPGWMERDELNKRLTVIRSVLQHESYALEPGNDPGAGAPRQVIRVRLTRKGCQPVVPFTLARHADGWLVAAVDLEAAGNPARTCQ